MALTKAQAQRAKRNTDYGAEPGEVTKGLKPGDRYYDADTNTWQKRDGASSSKANDYLNQLLTGEPNVGPQDRSAGGRPQGTEGSSGSRGKGGSGSGEAGEGSGGEVTPPANLQGDDLIDWLVRVAGMTAAAATAYARRSKPTTTSAGPSKPGIDTPGEADKGGTAVAPVPRPRSEGDAARSRAITQDLGPVADKTNISEDAFPELGYDPKPSEGDDRYRGAFSNEYQAYLNSQNALTNDEILARGQGPVAPEAQAAVGQDQRTALPAPGMVDQSIRMTMGDDAQAYHDPEMQAYYKQLINDIVGSGQFNPDALMDPKNNPDIPTDPYDLSQYKRAVQNEADVRARTLEGPSLSDALTKVKIR